MSGADNDCPWYFGSGSWSFGGDLLRSPLGGQLERMKQRQKLGGGFVPNEQANINVNVVEDAMLNSLDGLGRASQVRDRLAQLTPTLVAALRLHYSGKSLPYSVDPAAALLKRARRLCGVPDGKDAVIAPEVLRAVLMKTDEAERAALAKEADALVAGARDAYDRTHAERPRDVVVRDPRPWVRDR